MAVNEGLCRPIDGHGTSEDAPDVHRAAARRILEELGIALEKESLGEEVRLVSFGLDVSTYQYGLQGYAILDASKREVEECYIAAHERFEHSRLFFVPLTVQEVATFVANHQPWAPAGIMCFLLSVQAAYRNQGFGLDPCNLLKHLRNADIDVAFTVQRRSVRLWDPESKTVAGLTAPGSLRRPGRDPQP